ncbi:hypothetical protein F4808DRAFT_473661 [Astrocystis sublimbata]|nr:hypothetical protein F4808DRAFT_473661 [Astrocystis sublimbata]
MAISKFTTIGCTAAGLAVLSISTQLLPFYRAHHEYRASPTHNESFSISIVAPKKHPGIQESYSLSIPVKRFENNVSDEEILARFTKGFFSGLAFAPERRLLSILPFSGLTDIPAIKNTLASRSQNSLSDLVVGPDIWNPSSISPKATPSVASLLFGTFLVLDSSLVTPAQRDRLPGDYTQHAKPPHAFVDFAYGGERLGLVGSHRFEVSRHEVKQGSETEEYVKMTFSAVAGNPNSGLAPSRFLLWFHVLYSYLLFSDGIRGVLTE